MNVTKIHHIPGRIEQRVMLAAERAVREFDMFHPGDAVLIGVSGGPDSMALLHLLVSMASAYCLRLAVAHLNHGLRPGAADEEARFVAQAAEQLGLSCTVEKRDVAQYRRRMRLSLEEAARRVRYAFFQETAAENGFSKIALGHHADDNAELVLMNLLRGSGPAGLAGIPPVRQLDSDPGRRVPPPPRPTVVRPLIGVTRAEILEYLAQRSVPFRVDESNADPRHLRNRVRSQLLPLLKTAYNPNIVTTLNRLSAILRSEEHWIGEQTRDLYADLTGPPGQRDGVTLSIDALSGMHPAACRRLIRRAVAEVKGDLRRISFEHVAAVQALILSAKATARLDLPGGIRVGRYGDRLHVTRCSAPDPPIRFSCTAPMPCGQAVNIPIAETGDRLQFSETELPDLLKIRSAGHRVAFFDMDKIKFPLTIRNFRPGDRFTPFGMHGTKKVKKYFSDSGIPADRRRRCPLVISGGEIVWLAGFRVGAFASVDAATRRVLKGELFLA